MWKHRDTDEQKRLVKFTIAKTMRLALEYPELAQEYFDSLCKVIPDNERITVSNYQHNLTSDEEEEEMLCVKASKVREMYALNEKILYLDSTLKGAILIKKKLTDLFGSKCLHDELNEDNFATKKPEPAEPKNKDCDNHLADVDKMMDLRLNIAAMAMQGILANSHQEMVDMKIDKVAELAIEAADALIAECEEGGGNA